MENINCWHIGDKCLEYAPDDMYGFIYKITVSDSTELPEEIRGKIYIGKKQFLHRKRKVLSKKARKSTRKRVEIGTKDSGWKNYYGSNKELIQDVKTYGEKYFMREIYCFCKNKSELSYYELFYQISENVMFVNSYNSWISCRIFKKNLKS